ncbi:SHOCT domain-containing protein [Tistrella bauzanensis]|uniref:SHOCT domain-containing protein n=1 Tax=Tistrella TaxID=171436 RepID=UPI0031F63069
MSRFGLTAIGAVLASTAGVSPAIAQQWSYGPYMMWDHGWWGMIFGPIMMIALVAIIVVAVALLVRWLGGAGHQQAPHLPPGKTALDILKERFARGEVDKQEFEERRRALGE